MPSFFVSAKPKGGQKSRKRAAPKDDVENRISRRKKLLENTEIESDEETLSGSPRGSDVESDVEYEDARERNFREAKKLLDHLKETTQDEEELSKKLRDDAASRSGTLLRLVADFIELVDGEEICYKSHRLSPVCVAVSSDEKFIVSTGKESSIVKYDLENRKVVGVINRSKNKNAKSVTEEKAHFGIVFAIAISPDCRFLASGGFDNIIKIWDFDSLAHIKDLSGHRGTISSLCFQLKTNNLFSASSDRTVKLWDIDQLGLVDTMYGHQDAVHAVSCLAQQRVATVGGRDRSCRVWKVETESQLVFNGLAHCVSIDCVAMVNEEHFATGSADGSLAIWSVWKKKPIVLRKDAHGSANGESRWIISVAALPYSDILATGSNDGELKIWKIADGFKKLTPFYTYSATGFINSINFSPNGNLLALAVGQEHKDGRWWVNKEDRNRVIVVPIRYTNGANASSLNPQPERNGFNDSDEE